MDAGGPERLAGERRGQRRVDASGDADHHVAEAVLLGVVAQPELERQSHLLEVVEQRRDLRLDQLTAGLRRADVHDGHLRHRVPLALERSAPHVA